MEAQQRKQEAIALYRQARLNPALKDWAGLALDRLDREMRSQEYSAWPILGGGVRKLTHQAGVPVAIVASSAVEQVGAKIGPASRRCSNKRSAACGRTSGGSATSSAAPMTPSCSVGFNSQAPPSPTSTDARLEELARAEQAIRRPRKPYGRNAPRSGNSETARPL